MTGLNVYYHIKPGMKAAFIEAIITNNIGEKCRNEDGCLQYDYFTPLKNGDNLLVLIERWRDENAQKVHSTQPHFLLLQQLKEEYVEDTDIFNYNECR